MKIINKTLAMLVAGMFVSFTLISTNTVSAQTLQFNEVKLVTTSESVPAGKVWKVQSVGANTDQKPANPSNCNSSVASTQIAVNGSTIYVSATYMGKSTNCNGSYSGGWAIGSTGDITKLPVWLPEGTSLAAGTGAAYVSVIEFTVVP